MNYRKTIHAIETTTALEIMGITYEPKGAYVSFPCPNKAASSRLLDDLPAAGLPRTNPAQAVTLPQFGDLFFDSPCRNTFRRRQFGYGHILTGRQETKNLFFGLSRTFSRTCLASFVLG